MKKRLKNDIAIFTIGGLSYALIEILWRGYTHWTMIITGGICFVVLFRVFSRITHAKLWQKCAAGAAIITAIEFAAGCIVNLWLQMDVWDYSFLPLNLFGQVCLLYTFFTSKFWAHPHEKSKAAKAALLFFYPFSRQWHSAGLVAAL